MFLYFILVSVVLWNYNVTEGQSALSASNVPPAFPPGFKLGSESSLPANMGSIKQLYNARGYNLAIFESGVVRGVKEPFNKYAVLKFSSAASGVRIKGVEANLYLAMSEYGELYAKADGTGEDTIFREVYNKGTRYVNYVTKGWPKRQWFVAFNRSGNTKNGKYTSPYQKSVGFIPRPPYPSS